MLAQVYDLLAEIKQFLQERDKHGLSVQFSHGLFMVCNSHNLYVSFSYYYVNKELNVNICELVCIFTSSCMLIRFIDQVRRRTYVVFSTC